MRTLLFPNAVILAIVTLLSSAAQAKPIVLAAEGALLSQAGIAVDGKYAMALSLYDGFGAKIPFFQQKFLAIPVAAGRFAVDLGTEANQPLDGAQLIGKDLHIGVQVSDDPELPRVPFRPVPHAVEADVATSLNCTGCITAAMIEAGVLAPFAKSADLAKVATSGSYTDLLNTPNLSVYAKTAALANVAFTGAYSDLEGGPNLTPYAKTADLAGYAKAADVSKAGFSGNYADLNGKPDLAGFALTKVMPVLVSKAGDLNDGETLMVPHNGNTSAVLALAWYKDGTGIMRPVPLDKVATTLASDKDLVGRWTFDACNGADSSSFVNNGTLQNGPPCVAGKVGKALQFNGTDQYVQVPNSASLTLTSSAMSFGAWVFFTGGGGENITLNKESSYEMKFDGGPLQTAIASGQPNNWGWNAAGNVAQNQWIHVMAVYDGKAVTHYINGQSVGSYGQSGALPATACDLGIGARGLGCGGLSGQFHGNIDEAFVFRRALTAPEIANVYAGSWGSGGQWEMTQPDANNVALINHTGSKQNVVLVVLKPGG